MALGDAGDNTPEEKWVAEAMADHATRSSPHPSAVIMLGDNFYEKLDGTGDSKWRTLFEEAYDPKRLAIPFYVALGNHEYLEQNDIVQLDYAREKPESRWKMPARWYRVDLPAGAKTPLVTLLICDSNESDLGPERWEAQKAWLAGELSRIPANTWKVVCAHHPLFSNGVHGDDKQLQKEWGPIFRKGSADFYLCGHDHTMQHLEIDGWKTTFLVGGGGGAGAHVMLRDDRGLLSKSLHGFIGLRFSPEIAEISFIDYGGRIVHQATKNRAGNMAVLKEGGRDKPWMGRLNGTTPVE